MSEAGVDRPAWVRSYAGRHGRVSALSEERLSRLLPIRAIPDGPLDPVATFGRSARLVLEVGCGHGAAAIAYAAAHPDHDLLAVDVHRPGIARMLVAAEVAGIANLRVQVGDAVELLAGRIASSSLTAVHLFFPDPWPKSKHAKRRFVTSHTLALVHDRLVPGGQLLVATDKDRYAAHTLVELRAHGGFDIVVGERPAWRPTDGFEAKGRAAGRSISEIRATRLARYPAPSPRRGSRI
ncbi:MAG: tRNA (guanosine(46)-N7)-methyltransferase TrmB [Nostocoides sp.]